MDDLERFLDLVRRDLGCDDARFEFGGRDPQGDERVWTTIPGAVGGWRIVALFSGPVNDQVGKLGRLKALLDSFASIGDRLYSDRPRVVPAAASREVDDALGVLAERANALRAVVIDEDSPVLWGSSEAPRGPEDVEIAMWIGELADSAVQFADTDEGFDLDLAHLVQLEDAALREALAAIESRKLRERLARKLPQIREFGPHRTTEDWRIHFLTCRAIAAVRRAPERPEQVENGLGWLARDFAGIYHVILVYDGLFSEIGAAGVMQRALPAIENLVLALPPVDPTPKGARVLPFRSRG